MKAPKISALNTSFSDPFTFSVSSSAANTWIFLLQSYLYVRLLLCLCYSADGRYSSNQWVQFFKNFILSHSKEISFLGYWKATAHVKKRNLDFTNCFTWMATSDGDQEKQHCVRPWINMHLNTPRLYVCVIGGRIWPSVGGEIPVHYAVCRKWLSQAQGDKHLFLSDN